MSSSSDSGEDDPSLAAFEGARAAQRGETDRPNGRGSGRCDRAQRAGRYASAPLGSEPRKRDRDPRPAAASDAPSRDSRRPRRATEQLPPSATRGQPTQAPQLPPDAPSPDADPKDIQAYIRAHRVCFNHAGGRQCRRMVEVHHCPYLHTETPIPFKAYLRGPPPPPALAALGEFDENLLYAAEALSAWSNPPLPTRRPGTAANTPESAPRMVPLQGTLRGTHQTIAGGSRFAEATRMAVTAVAPMAAMSGPSRGSHQTWVTACLWNKIRHRLGYRTTVLLDSGAGGGNFCSDKFIRAVERTEYNGKRIVSTRGRRLLRAPNPSDSGVAPMSVVGTAVLPLVFPPVDRVFRARLRVFSGRTSVRADPGRRLYATLRQCHRLRRRGLLQAGTGRWQRAPTTTETPTEPSAVEGPYPRPPTG